MVIVESAMMTTRCHGRLNEMELPQVPTTEAEPFYHGEE